MPEGKDQNIEKLLRKAAADKYGLGSIVDDIEKIKPFIEKMNTMQDFIKGEDGKTPELGKDYLTEEQQQAALEMVRPKKGVDYDDGVAGADGYTPIKGLDYLTDDEMAQIRAEAKPVKGQDYFTPEEVASFKDGITPIKGKDYNDGENPTPQQFLEVIKGLKGQDAAAFSQVVGSKIDISHVRNAGSFIFNGKKYKTEELMHGGGSGGTGGTPGGLNTQLQYNNAGTFGGITGAVTNGTSVSLTAAHLLNPTINGSGTGLATLVYPNTSSSATITVPETTGTLALTSQLTSGTVTTVSVVINQGVSGTVATATTTPAITLSLGALTGVTSFNGLVITANTGVITTGTWQATKIGLAFGGTNADLSATGGTSQVLKQVSSGAAVTVGQLAASDLSNGTTGSGSVVLATAPTMSNPVVGTQTTTDNSTKAASTAYVTTAIANAIAGVNPAVAVQAATTAAGDTSGFTYNNGVSGIGATFTGSNNTAVTIDGFTFTALGQRLLVKNDTQSPSGAFNGVYYVTQIQTAILPPILTRALDYDMPSDINNTGAIPVVNGTANATTSWLLTSLVTTVGTDPLTYVQFSRSPTSVLPANLGGTGVANNVASTLTISGAFGTTFTVSGTTSLTLPTSGTVATLTGTQTLTNKRNTRRVITTTQSATPTINTDNTDVAAITGLAQAITSFTTNLSGTPVAGDLLEIQITDNGTARAITWGTSFESTTVTLPSTTVISTMLRIGFEWNTAASKWDCIAVA